MDAIDAETPDSVVLLGDLLYHGPRNGLPFAYAPKEVIPMLNSLAGKVIAVRGNCDAEVDQTPIDSCSARTGMCSLQAIIRRCPKGARSCRGTRT